MTENDRRAVIYATCLLGLVALVGSIALAAVVVLRLDRGDDVAPGVAALLMALVGLVSTVVGFLAPSPLSKSATSVDASGAPSPIPVTVADEPVAVTVESDTATGSKRR